MVGEAHRLRALQVGVAREQRVEVLARALDEDALEPGEPALGRGGRVAQVEREVRRDLVVAAAPGVEAAGDGPDQLPEPRLDVHVHVLEARVERERPRLDLRADALEARRPAPRRPPGVEDARRAEHRGVGDRAPQVVAGERAVEVHRRGEALDGRVRLFREAAPPGLLAAVRHGLTLQDRGQIASPAPCASSHCHGAAKLAIQGGRPGGRRAAAGAPGPTSPRRAGFALAFWLVALAAGLGLGFETARLDQIVRARFEGRLFRVPSKVLSSPVVLCTGLDCAGRDLSGTLDRLGYRELRGRGPAPAGALPPRGRAKLAPPPARLRPPDRGPSPTLEASSPSRARRIARDPRRPRPRASASSSLEPELVGAYYGPDRAQRELVGVDELPPHVVDAVLAVEDQRFFDHQGVDAVRILGALVANLRSGRVIQGGSTLTQQLVKNFFLTPERSLTRKLQEAWMSLIVEARYEKRAILEAYLNEIYLGQRGATAGPRRGRGPRASTSGRTRASSRRRRRRSSPRRSTARTAARRSASPRRLARERRNLVLDMMARAGTARRPTVATAAKAEPLGLAPLTPEPREARFFLDFLRRELPRVLRRRRPRRPGHAHLLDARPPRSSSSRRARCARGSSSSSATSRASRRGRAGSRRASSRSGRRPARCSRSSAGATTARASSTAARQARRPVGSAFKPFVYAAALEPIVGGPTDHPRELARRQPALGADALGALAAGELRQASSTGAFARREALARSLNVATARLGQQVGPARIAEVARRLGIESPLPEVPSLALGAADVAPIELARRLRDARERRHPARRCARSRTSSTRRGARVERQADPRASACSTRAPRSS